MSPFRRRKRSSRAGSRRRELVERERLRYERERSGAQPESEPEQVESPPEAAASKPEEQKKPLLPETARRAREKRSRPRRRRISRPSVPRLAGMRSASRSGARATVRQTAPGVRRLVGGVARLLGRLAALVLRIAGLIERALLAIFDTARGSGGRALAFAERQLTPERVLVAVIAAAGGLLVYSQFVAYRGVEVGQPQYTEVSTVAPAPQTDRIDAGAAHAYVLIPLAAIAVAIALVALISGRWRLGRLVSLVGLIGIAISLAIDLPKGLDAGTAGAAFAGAKATLTEGFYAQLAASAVLVLCGWVLSVDLRLRAGVPAGKRRFRRPRARQRQAPSVAGGGA